MPQPTGRRGRAAEQVADEVAPDAVEAAEAPSVAAEGASAPDAPGEAPEAPTGDQGELSGDQPPADEAEPERLHEYRALRSLDGVKNQRVFAALPSDPRVKSGYVIDLGLQTPDVPVPAGVDEAFASSSEGGADGVGGD